MRFRLLLAVAGGLVCADGFRVSSQSRLVSSNRRGVVRSAVPQVFVRKVAPAADAEMLRTAMEEEFGRVTSVWLPPRDNAANHNQGYGTVTFDDSASMQMAVEVGTLVVMGKSLQISESTRANASPITNSEGGREALLQHRESKRREKVESRRAAALSRNKARAAPLRRK